VIGAAEVEADGASTTREFSTLAAGIDDMIEGLVERERELDEAITERRNLIRRFLPADVVRRLDAGDRDLVERIPNATVVAIVIEGLGTLVDTESADAVRRELEDTIASFDDIAQSHGLDRVKIVGDTYFAVCGLGRPYLDHAPRSVAFAREALEEFEATRDRHEVLNTSVGIASGPIAAGLAGSYRLIFDTWGTTVTEAALLARSGRPGSITVAKSVIDQLPESIEARERPEIPEVGAAWEIAVPDGEGGAT
jgi:class 3 adenylate cyclase